MRRDWELVREILKAVEALKPDEETCELTFDGYDSRTVYHHVALLLEAKLLQGRCNLNFGNNVYGYEIVGLTWAGHDFVEKARSDVLWRKAMTKTAEAGTGLSFGVLGDLLAAMARSALGM